MLLPDDERLRPAGRAGTRTAVRRHRYPRRPAEALRPRRHAVGGLAARLAGNRLFGLTIDRPEHAAELKAALGGLKGPLMKVAQILATVPDMLPEEYTLELAQLQHNAPSMGWAFVKRRMKAELGPDWQSRFAEFEHTAAAAASLGQVHRATGARRPRCWRASCNIRTWPRRSKPTCSSSR